MATNLQTSPEPGLSSLLTGIFNDVQDLIKQQLALFKHEVGEDVRQTREAATSLVVGLGILFVAAVLFCLMLVHLLNWAFTDLPLWACYGLVGVAMSLLGALMTWAALQKFHAIHPLPEQTVATLKEDLAWTSKPR